jgi:hypothetical protein
MDSVLQSLYPGLQGSTGQILAIGSFVAALGLLLKAIYDLVKTIKKLRKEMPTTSHIKAALSSLVRKPYLYVGLAALLIVVGVSYVRSLPGPMPSTDTAMKGVFDEFNTKNYDEAIKKAAECTRNFQSSADPLEERLEKAFVAVYPVGKVSEAQKQDILDNGALNAVAACYWVQGRAYDAKGDLKQAKEGYVACARYTYARIYDPSGDFFWSPSDDCAKRAQGIQ